MHQADASSKKLKHVTASTLADVVTTVQGSHDVPMFNSRFFHKQVSAYQDIRWYQLYGEAVVTATFCKKRERQYVSRLASRWNPNLAFLSRLTSVFSRVDAHFQLANTSLGPAPEEEEGD